MEAIIAGTRTGAEMLKLDGELGTVEIGKIADLLLVSGDPIADIRNLTKVEHVIQGGQLLTLPLVDLNAYGYA